MLIGIPSAYSHNVLGLFYAAAGELFLVIGAFFLALFVGYRFRGPLDEAVEGFSSPGLLKGWLWVVRVLVPILLAVVIYDRGANVVSMIAGLLGN